MKFNVKIKFILKIIIVKDAKIVALKYYFNALILIVNINIAMNVQKK